MMADTHQQHIVEQHPLLEEAMATKRDLPAFDELLIAYKDRARFVPAEFAPLVGPGINGMCHPFTARGGIVIGGQGPARKSRAGG